MSIQSLKDTLPEYAKDLKLNIGSLASETVLGDTEKYGTFIAAAIASRNPVVIEAITTELAPKLDASTYDAAKAAAAIMGMSNVYYRFLHLVEDEEYGRLPARLRMNILASPGVPRVQFELWCLAVSAVNGCGKCVASHERVLREAGVTREQIQAAVRIAAVVHAIAATLAGEAAAVTIETAAQAA